MKLKKSGSSTGSRLRKKHKRLDAICERVYTQNHSESVADLEPRRSSRMRRPPDLLDASPPPAKKRKKINSTYASGSLKGVKEEDEAHDDAESGDVGDLDSPESWKSRLRTRGVRQKGGQSSRRRKLFHQSGTAESKLDRGKLGLVKSRRLGRVKAVNGSVGGDKEVCLQLGEGMSGKGVAEVCVGKDESAEDELDLPRNEGSNGGMRISGEEISRGVRKKGEQNSRRRKLFHQLATAENELGSGKLRLLKSKTLRRIKAVNGSVGGDKEACLQLGEDMIGKDVDEVRVRKDESVEDELDLPRNEGADGGMIISVEEVSRGIQQKGGQTSQRMKLFHQLGTAEIEFGHGKLGLVKSKRLGRIKAANDSIGADNEACLQHGESMSGKDVAEECVGKDESTEDELDLPRNEGEEGGMRTSGEEIGGGNTGEGVDGNALQSELDQVEKKQRPDGMELDERLDGNGHVENVEQMDNKNVEEFEVGANGKDEADILKVDGALTNDMEEGRYYRKGDSGIEVNDMTFGGVRDGKVEAFKRKSANIHGRSQVKHGRRCGLCGCGNDGKPPKRLLQDTGDSENEAYSGSSASEEVKYDVWDGFGDEPGWLGCLLGPVNDRYGIAGIWVHQHCAVWSPEVYFAGLGCLKNVRAALCRGRALKCSRCGRPGATIGCRVDRCPKTYHLPCARASSCIFDHRKFLIACTYHRHLFQPHGIQYAMRIKKLKAKKMKLELRKVSNDAWRKDVEAEEKWMEKCGEDDEFLKREGKRLHRDLLRIAPVYIGGSESESGKAFDGWESVAGLQDVIRCMKEVVILPLLYPEFFSNLGITPPRGILLHGYPGTGKTLVVRALIGSCARGDKRIAYFARKGADCLGKYVGDAERQLRLLFQVAERCQPSVIFFDEIDGLAPVRTRQQDQTHSSVVSTLLALMDGLKSRGSVVVIGATNRPEAVDPALRRPGRFDREIYFPLPSVEDRAAILSLHTQRWPKPVSGSLLKWIATETAGFAGADLQALCTQAVIIALKRNFPLQKVLSAAGKGAPGSKRTPLPAFAVDERDWLEALACAPPPCSHREAGIAASDFVSSPLPTHLIPCLLQPLCTFLVSIYLHEDLWLPPSLLKAGTMIKNVIVSFLEKKNTPSDTWWSHVDNFLKEAEVERDVRRRLSCAGMLIGDSRCIDTDSFAEHEGSLHSDVSRTTYFAPRTKSGFRVLVAGSSRSGQRHLASCILHCFVGNVEIQKVDLATLSQEGHGELVRGITQILMRCTGFHSCMIFMPRIDLWAMEGCHPTSGGSNASPLKNELSPMKESCSPQSQVIESKNDSSAYQCEASESTKPQLSSESASLAWSTFVEQVESVCVSTSLMILATSELPYNELPPRVRQFFKGDFSNSSLSKPLQHTIPRFVVNIDGKFNRPAVISLSAEELLRDMIQSFVQFIHQRNHVHTSCEKEYTVSESVQGCLDAENPTKDHTPKVPPLPSTRNFKGKSTLLLAISTFGYQILRYPHFAELCWVTSKLREGPCADVSGPWKGWPFNSCIIRPGNPLDKEAVGCSSGNIKTKEISGVVRGLMAVGLLAYRGMYSSSKDVSFEVRNVLELLVGQVNEKIQAGKDRYQYVRLLSQVAHLEDMINNWAYSLQSLEPEGNMEMANATETTKGIPNDTLRDDAVQCHCKENTSGRNTPESELQGGSPKGFTHENLEGSPEGESGFCHPDSERTAAFSEDGTAQNHSVCDCITCKNPDEHFQKSTAGDQLAGNITNEQNGTTIGLSELIDTEEPAVNDGNSGSLKHSDGFTVVDNSNSSENSFQFQNPAKFSGFDFLGAGMFSYRSSELSAVGDKTGSNNAEPNCIDNVGDTNLISETSSISDSGVTCSYHCCDGCLHALHSLIQKILVNEWGLNEMDLTVEDIHDAVASCSVSLLSAVRKVDTAETPRNSSDENSKCANAERYSDWPELSECCCGTSENGVVMPMECSCHSAIGCVGCVTGEANDSLISQCGFHPNFVFRDGVLVPVDSNTTTLVSFHCKYNNLCLCSIIKSVVMVKQALD